MTSPLRPASRRFLSRGRASWLSPALFLLALTALLAGGVDAQGKATQGQADQAQSLIEPDPQPFLMLDAGMHTGIIYRVSVDASGELLATGSTDKSIRLWNLRTGRAIRKIHLPLGEGTKGEVTALALSPSGTFLLAATTAFDTRSDFQQGDIHVIRVEDGRTIARLSGFRSTFSHLAFSPDSTSFAAVLGKWGMQIWAADGRELFHDYNLEDPYLWLDYGPDGRLAAVTAKGHLRLYRRVEDDRIQLVQAGDLPRGLVPYSIAFSPDGLFLAVGYADTPRVDLFDGDTLALVKSLALPKGTKGNLGAVAWSSEADGSPWLYAAGTVQDEEERNIVMAWPYGQDLPRRLPVADDSITHLHPVPGGGVIYASTEPSWGHVTATAPGKGRELAVLAGQGPLSYDFRQAGRDGLVLDSEATKVWVKPRKAQEAEAAFDLRGLALLSSAPPQDGYRPSAARKSTKVSGWYIGTDPRINDRSLTLADGKPALFAGERSLSVDVSGDGGRVLLGTDYFLRLFDASGRELARHRLSTPAWAVALPPRGDVAVAALGDGTVRWYALSEELSLEELGGVFLHNDGRRWVAWTADGRFAHSDYGGASLAGFQFNGTRSQLTGQWLSLASLYRLMFRPEVVAALLDDRAQWPAFATREGISRLARQLDRPAIDLVAFCALQDQLVDWRTRGLLSLSGPPPAEAECREVTKVATGLRGGQDGQLGDALPEGTTALELRFRVASGTPETVDAFVNGRNVGRFPLDSEATRGSGELAVTLPVYPGQNVVTLRTYGASGVYREIGPIYATVPVSAEPREERVLYIVAAGVDEYRGSITPLSYAVADASGVADTLARLNSAGELYTRVETKVLPNGEATREAVLEALAEVAAKAGAEDSIVVYLAGHGVTEAGGYAFVPSDVTNLDNVLEQGINGDDLVGALGNMVARNVFLFLDTCYSGVFRLEQPATLAHESGRFVLTAAKAEQEALDKVADADHGVFAYAVMQGLEGRAALVGADQIGALGLGSFVRSVVRELAEKTHPGTRQDAVFKTAGGDIAEFPLAPVPTSGKSGN